MNNNLLKVTSQSGINQIRGVNRAGATGAGIPQHVTNLSASVANASVGLTSAVALTFRRDPSDPNFGGVTVWAKGYQGNQSPTQVANGQDSPITFILNNTGEALSLIVQANGNGGSAPIGTAPTTGLTLPKSTGGGVGTTTVTSASSNIAVTVPSELSINGSPINTGTGGTFAIGKATQSANTIWAGPTSGSAAQPTFRNLARPDIAQVPLVWSYGARYNGNGAVTTFGGANTAFATSTFISARVAPTANDTALLQAGMSTTASANAYGAELDAGSINSGIVRGILQRYACRIKHNNTANCRYWVGLVASGNGPAGNATGLATDTPNFAVAAFRYSSTTDTTYQAVLATNSANATVTDTGVAVDTTKSHLFEITYDGTNFNFWIDGVLKVTTNTNQPGSTTLLNGVFSVDNKNTANAATVSFNWLMVSHA